MNPEDISFEEFFAERLKQKGLSAKKLAETTGISPRHLQEIARGDFSSLPSAPYVRGYLIRLGQELDFDGDAWWQKIKIDRRVKSSGPVDSLPENRFLKKAPTRIIVIGIIALIVVVYFVIQLPKILGKPTLSLNSPAQNPFTTNISPLTLDGTTANANSLSVDGESVPLNSDGSWQKNILLSSGPNQVIITAKKFLGRTTAISEEIIYEPPAVITTSSTPTSTASNTSPSSTTTP